MTILRKLYLKEVSGLDLDLGGMAGPSWASHQGGRTRTGVIQLKANLKPSTGSTRFIRTPALAYNRLTNLLNLLAKQTD
jgi:hypothetical protein